LGITFESPEQALTEKEIVVRCTLEGKEYGSIEIVRLFSASKMATLVLFGKKL